MRGKLNKRILSACFFILLSFVFFSCGIEELYYLPQQGQGSREFNTSATIFIDDRLDQIYYATGYAIFYRIYLSSYLESGDITQSPNVRRDINQTLSRHFNELEPFADPTKTTSITTFNTFPSRFFYKLELEYDGVEYDIDEVILKNGGRYIINFNDNMNDHPVTLSVIDTSTGVEKPEKYRLLRTSDIDITIKPDNNRYFLFNNDLNIIDENTKINHDVQRHSANNDGIYAYVLMYLVAVGQNPVNFNSIYSKPTLINIFRLPT